jgi:ABC-type molybdate transport system substrate-binding protein
MPTQPKPLSRVFMSLGIALAGLGLAYAPVTGMKRTITVVNGSELDETLQVLVPEFQRQHPDIEVVLKSQGSQDMVNRYLDDRNDFQPNVLIPADAQFLQELQDRWQTQHNNEAFVGPPRAIAKTNLVAIAWPERGKTLFPQGKFSWDRIEKAMQGRNWPAVGGAANWGSFDFVLTDPTRSNSGLLTLALWSESEAGALSPAKFTDPQLTSLFQLIKQSVYQPPRSSDILLKEFIARGANEADIGITYESIALYRWSQAQSSQQPYQIYYLDRTVETTPTAAIVSRHSNAAQTAAAQKWIDFLLQTQGQTALAQHGFRPVNPQVNLSAIPNTPWKQGIPGADLKPTSQIVPPPSQPVLDEIQRQWERSR